MRNDIALCSPKTRKIYACQKYIIFHSETSNSNFLVFQRINNNIIYNITNKLQTIKIFFDFSLVRK